VLPVPKLPKVSVGTRIAFDSLDGRLRARWRLVGKPAENCRNPYDGCLYGAPDSGSADSSAAGETAAANDAAAPEPPVEVLAQGQTGPYDYKVVKGSDAAGLYAWLNDNGYVTPAAAQPILAVHVQKGDVFVAVKLQNGKGSTRFARWCTKWTTPSGDLEVVMPHVAPDAVGARARHGADPLPCGN
jgi:hypothetical protein